jgi:multiple sugar transport system ATP-binding protein
MANLSLREIHKSFGAVPVVRGIDLEIAEGEFTVLLGPSGCGKSTLLRVIAGLEEADSGSVVIGGDVVDEVRPRDRDIAMVFQSYALYPYMSVYENIAFGMRMRKLPEAEIREQVAWAAKMLEIEPLLQRAPRDLSGGQRQRVAIGRAMVRRPRLFLFDEPLSNLDAQLREGMRGEIKRLHETLGITTVYVTHDQIEAMTLADRVVLMNQGVIEQQGPPMALYDQPVNRFVASFLGSPSINYLPARVRRASDGTVLVLADGTPLALPAPRGGSLAAGDGAAITLGLRPEHFVLRPASEPGVLRSRVQMLQPAGPRVFATIELAGVPVTAEFSAREPIRRGETISFGLDMARAVLLHADSGQAVGS